MRGRRVEGHKLRALRLRALLRPRELAHTVGCSVGHLRNIETSDDQPSDLLAHRIAHALSTALGHEITVEEFSTPLHAREAA